MAIKTQILIGLLSCGWLAPAWSEGEYQIQCAGHPPMEMVMAQYGVNFLLWPPDQQMVMAAGTKFSHLANGDPVTITAFVNGDQLLEDSEDDATFFRFADSGQSEFCGRTSTRPLPEIEVQRYEPDQQKQPS